MGTGSMVVIQCEWRIMSNQAKEWNVLKKVSTVSNATEKSRICNISSVFEDEEVMGEYRIAQL